MATCKQDVGYQQNQPILSANKIARFCQPCSIFDDFVSRLFVYRTTDFVYVAMVIVYNERRIFILVIYRVCYLFSLTNCRKSEARIILRSAFGCCAS